jgi:hypothetical protein
MLSIKCIRASILQVVALGGAMAAPLASADVPAREALVAEAAVPWHADLAAAQRAATVSHRPVLVIFSAGSTESGAALARDVFPAAETVALLTACFEPVRIDVDADASTARAMGIAQIPMACIVDAHDRILAKFECPTAPAAFVAAASRAAQEAAAAGAGAVTPVAAIREQSDFVSQAVQVPPPAPVIAPPAGPPAFNTAAEEPVLPAAPPAWPAEQSTRPMPFSPDTHATQDRQTIEPSTSAPGNAAWLNAPPAAPAAGTVATAAPPPPPPPGPPPGPPTQEAPRRPPLRSPRRSRPVRPSSPRCRSRSPSSQNRSSPKRRPRRPLRPHPPRPRLRRCPRPGPTPTA